VTVIHPTLTDRLKAWADEGCFSWLQRTYQRGDLRGAFLIIAERADPASNTAIWQEAEANGALVNVMDDVDHCNFVAGSVVRQGPLTISISTSGAAPALAVRLRQEMERNFGPEYADFLVWMQALRPFMAQAYPDFSERRALYYKLVDTDILDLLAAEDKTAALRRVAETIGEEGAARIAAPA
jgi:precorrin-2 dehydrogenase/sirohydrochlorin ferrochelatase